MKSPAEPVLKLYKLEDAENLSREQLGNLYRQHLNPELFNMFRLIGFDRKYVRAEGMHVYDEEGRKYLDLLGAYGAMNFGHNRPEIHQALQRVQSFPNLLQVSMGVVTSLLAANLAQITPGDLNRTFFGNSGAEAVEGALKLARIATGRQTLIYAENSFHGKSFGALSVTGRTKYQTPFEPLLPKTELIPYGNAARLEERLARKDVAAVILEPIQGEAGILVPAPGYLSEARAICTRHGSLLILDEIQTGFGRTGWNFACEAESVVPDVLCLGKSLGGGVMPIGAYITNDKIWNAAYGQMERAALHTSTFGGNTLAAAAALESIRLLVEEGLAEQAREKGEYFLAKLQDLQQKYPVIAEVRGRGLLIGLEFASPKSNLLNTLTGGTVKKLAEEYFASIVAGQLLNEHGIITAYTLNNPNVIRFEPPLIIKREEIDYVVQALEAVLKNQGMASIALRGAKSAVKGLIGR
jgi:putrescine aminotransferase